MKSYCFGPQQEYSVLVAGERNIRERALSLVYGVYLARGLCEARTCRMQISIFDALPGTRSFLVERSGREDSRPAAVASLTVIPDGPLGIPMDTMFKEELDGLRAGGRRPLQLSKLATVASTGQKAGNRRPPREEILLHLFKLAYLTARHIENASDLIIAVSAHQARYFRRVLLFEQFAEAAGDEFGELSVPLRLNLDEAEDLYRKRYRRRSGEHNLFNFFVETDREEIVSWLEANPGNLSPGDLQYLFMQKSAVLAEADEAALRVINELYPQLVTEDTG